MIWNFRSLWHYVVYFYSKPDGIFCKFFWSKLLFLLLKRTLFALLVRNGFFASSLWHYFVIFYHECICISCSFLLSLLKVFLIEITRNIFQQSLVMILCYIYIYIFFYILNLLYFLQFFWTQLKVWLIWNTSIASIVRAGPVHCYKWLNWSRNSNINVFHFFPIF